MTEEGYATAGSKPLTEYESAHTNNCQRQGMWCCLLCGGWLVDSLAIQLHFGLYRASLIYPKKRVVWPGAKIWREIEGEQRCPKAAGVEWLAFACKTPEHGWEEP